jgi:hypothetical protein
MGKGVALFRPLLVNLSGIWNSTSSCSSSSSLVFASGLTLVKALAEAMFIGHVFKPLSLHGDT